MPDSYNLRSRDGKMASSPNGSATTESSSSSPARPPTAASSSSSSAPQRRRNPPHLPTALEALLLLVYPTLLTFGTVFSVLSPETRAAPYDAVRQSHIQASAPSYFARKDNLFNVVFVKRGWFWVTVAFFAFALTHPGVGSTARRVKAALRWALVTGWWVLVTQWCFGPAIIDRGFRLSGGKCEVVENAIFEEGSKDKADVFTAVACRATGGRWSGGHDISGHVFLLVLGSWFLVQEVGWVVLRMRNGTTGMRRDERSVVMGDGAVKGAGVEAERSGDDTTTKVGLGLGGKFAVSVIVLCLWMLLMTAIYFHTWFEKLTGLLVAFFGIYVVYFLPRWMPAWRAIVGLPGI